VRARRAALVAVLAALVAGCGDDGASSRLRLYLWLDGSELAVKLIEREPDPY
jgi:hypothetical protein